MLLVKTTLGKSIIPKAEKGLFADEFIPKGMMIWKFEDGKDFRFTREEYEKMSTNKRAHIRKYAYAKKDSPTITLPSDDSIYTNHSNSPNTYGESDDLSFALKDIMAGEEITEDYTKYDDGEFCSSFLRKKNVK
jgi:hypothetical protein